MKEKKLHIEYEYGEKSLEEVFRELARILVAKEGDDDD